MNEGRITCSPAAASASPADRADPFPLVSANATDAGALTATGAAHGVSLLVACAIRLDAREGGHAGAWLFRDHEVPVAHLRGPGIDATAKIDRHGDATVRGTFPKYAEHGLREIAERELIADDRGESTGVEAWVLDPAGDAVSYDEDAAEAAWLIGLARRAA